jgi:predicted anti-sigma-YlaC factor YlaD
MGTIARSQRCERARERISLQIDGELSELEQAALVRHLVECPDCQGFRADTVSITRHLRRAPLEQLERQLLVRRRRRSPVRAVGMVTTAAAAAAIVAATTFGLVQGRGSAKLPHARPDSIVGPLGVLHQTGQSLPVRGRVKAI